MKRIYIAGPMTGLPGFNYSEFDAAAEVLRDDNTVVINPAENHGRNTTLPRWRYISKSIDQIHGLARLQISSTDSCYVVVLDGWEESEGALLEVNMAHQLGLPIYHIDCFIDPHMTTGCRIIPSYKVTHSMPCPTTLDKTADTLQETCAAEGFAEPPQKLVRASVLDEAIRLTCGDRNAQYGPPGKDFNRAANALTSLGFGKEAAEGDGCEVLSDHDVAIIMIVLKLSRLMWSPTKRDSWVDVAGYAGCGAEVAGAE